MIDLPIKLMVVVLIITLSVPVLAGAMEKGESNNAASAVNSEIDRIFNAAAAAHYSGVGSTRTVSVNIPEGCEITIPGGGGSEGYSMTAKYKGKDLGTRYMDRPPVRFISDNIAITGKCMLLITSDVIDGDPAVKVDLI